MDEAKQVLLKAAEFLQQGRKICLATIVAKKGSGPRPVGSKMVFCEDGETFGSIGGGAIEHEVEKIVGEVLKSGTPRLLDFDLSGKASGIDAYCGGQVTVLVEPLGTSKKLFVVGGGHVGKAVARLASQVGFSVTVVDNRKDALDEIAGVRGIRVLAAEPDQISSAGIDEDAFVVICTRSHSLDESFLEGVLPLKPRYLGMLGSRNKAKTIFKRLEAKGFDRSLLEQVHIPIGVDIGAVTPEEIGVSIVAELIGESRSKEVKTG